MCAFLIVECNEEAMEAMLSECRRLGLSPSLASTRHLVQLIARCDDSSSQVCATIHVAQWLSTICPEGGDEARKVEANVLAVRILIGTIQSLMVCFLLCESGNARIYRRFLSLSDGARSAGFRVSKRQCCQGCACALLVSK